MTENEKAQQGPENKLQAKDERLKGKTFLTSHGIQPMVTVEKERKTLGPVMGQSPAQKPLLQVHGLKIPEPEERAAEILEKAKAARARAKAAEAKKR